MTKADLLAYVALAAFFLPVPFAAVKVFRQRRRR